jgi:hypothetical protein
MPRASSILCLPAALVFSAAAPAIELPVIVNGTQVAQAKSQPVAAPAADKKQLPVIRNYPSAAFGPADQKSDGKAPKIVNNPGHLPANAAPARVAVAYTVPTYPDYMAPVAYNAYRTGAIFGFDAGAGYGFSAPYGGNCGGYYGGGYGFGGYVLPGYDFFGPWGYGFAPPLVEVLDTGVRANAGHLTSMPSVAAPVYGHVMGVYYR